MLYIVKYRYVDTDGNEIRLVDGYDRSIGMSFPGDEGDMTHPYICAYRTRKIAEAVKKDLDSAFEDAKRRKLVKKTWKAKVVPVEEKEFKTDFNKLEDNAAFRYYWTIADNGLT